METRRRLNVIADEDTWTYKRRFQTFIFNFPNSSENSSKGYIYICLCIDKFCLYSYYQKQPPTTFITQPSGDPGRYDLDNKLITRIIAILFSCVQMKTHNMYYRIWDLTWIAPRPNVATLLDEIPVTILMVKYWKQDQFMIM